MADSMLIDKLGDEFMRERINSPYYESLTYKDFQENPELAEEIIDHWLAKKYWQGESRYSKEKIGDYEILADSAIVTEVIEDSAVTLRPGMNVEVTEDGIIEVGFTFFTNAKESQNLSDEENQQIIKYVQDHIIDCKIEQKSYDKTIYEGRGYLKKGARLQISSLRTSLSKNVDFGNENQGKYRSMSFDFYVDKKLFKRSDNIILFRLETALYYNNKAYDIGKYLKKF